MKSSLLLNGDTLNTIQTNEQLKESLLDIVEMIDVFLACRVSPK